MQILVKSASKLNDEELNWINTVVSENFNKPLLNQDILNSLKATRSLWFICFIKNKKIGLASLRDTEEDNLTNICILPEYRNNGYGSMLINNVILFYREHKKSLNNITLTVDKNDSFLVELYTRKGFEIYKTSDTQHYMELKNKKSYFV